MYRSWLNVLETALIFHVWPFLFRLMMVSGLLECLFYFGESNWRQEEASHEI